MESAVVVSTVATVLRNLSTLFSLSSNSDTKYAISRLLREVSDIYSEISSENIDQERIRSRFAAINDELKKFRDQQAERKAPDEIQKIAAEASQSIDQLTTSA